MNGYELIRKLQNKMQDSNFAQKFNRLAQELNSIPGLQQEIIKIAQMTNERERQKAIKKLPDNVKKFIREIWYLTISYDAYYRSNGRIFLSTVLHNFGETTNTLLDYSIDDKDYIFYQKSIGKKLRNFGFADNREILIDELGRING